MQHELFEDAVTQAKDPKVKTALQQSVGEPRFVLPACLPDIQWLTSNFPESLSKVASNQESLDETKSIYSNIARNTALQKVAPEPEATDVERKHRAPCQVTFSDSMLALLKKTSSSGELRAGVDAIADLFHDFWMLRCRLQLRPAHVWPACVLCKYLEWCGSWSQ